MGRRPGSSGADGRSLSIVVPAHQEAEGIAWTVRVLREGIDQAVAEGAIDGGEIVVVDDRSTDGTAAVLEQLAAERGPTLRPIPGDEPGGLGTAIRTGLAAARGDIVLYTDADLPFDPMEISHLVGVLRRYDADAVCGYRHDRTSEGMRRAAQSHAFNLLARAVLPIRIRDVNFACKLLTRPALDQVLPELRSTGPFIDAELVARLSKHDLRVAQVGLDYFPRFDTASTLGGSSAILAILREGASMQGELRRGR